MLWEIEHDVAIVGCGAVGLEIASQLTLENPERNIILFDRDDIKDGRFEASTFKAGALIRRKWHEKVTLTL